MKKTLRAKLFIGLFISVLFSSALGGVALADHPAGCYDNNQLVTCPADTVDTYGEALAPGKCYTAGVGLDPKSTTPSTSNQWVQVSCSDLTTAITTHACGDANNRVYTSIDLGCQGKGNPIMDMMFGIIRFLSDGIGIVVIASIIIAGIQYSTSAGDPQAAAKAITRLRSAVVALLIFIFAYAILNYVIPGTFLQ